MSTPSTYKADGFQVFTQIVSQPLLTQAAAAVAHITADYATLPAELQQRITLLTDLPDQRFSVAQTGNIPAVPYLIGELPAFGEAFRELLLLPTLWQYAAEVLETETVVYHSSNVTSKPAGMGPRLNWHRDFPNRYICPHTSRFTRLLIPLDGMHPANGCTQLVCHSHWVTDEEAREEARNGKKPSQMAIAPETLIDIVCEQGDVAFLHPKSIHGGGHNESQTHRRVVIIQFGVANEPLETNNRESFTAYTYQQMNDAW